MERSVLLQIVDAAWKDHLLAMDHLRSAVGLVGYAQVDPKVEYKREGMKTFDQMWTSIGQRVTDLIFRMEQLDEGLVGSTWVETSATHAQAESASEIAQQQQAAIDASQPHGFAPIGAPTVIDQGPNRGNRIAYLRDPDGNLIELSGALDRAKWSPGLEEAARRYGRI